MSRKKDNLIALVELIDKFQQDEKLHPEKYGSNVDEIGEYLIMDNGEKLYL